MRADRILSFSVIVIWLITLIFVAGPVRWEFAHSYGHWISGIGDELPLPTALIGLPILNIGEVSPSSIAVRVVFWSAVWLGPIILLLGVWRAIPENVANWMLYGGVLYATIVISLAIAICFSLWLPFSLL